MLIIELSRFVTIGSKRTSVYTCCILQECEILLIDMYVCNIILRDPGWRIKENHHNYVSWNYLLEYNQ